MYNLNIFQCVFVLRTFFSFSIVYPTITTYYAHLHEVTEQLQCGSICTTVCQLPLPFLTDKEHLQSIGLGSSQKSTALPVCLKPNPERRKFNLVILSFPPSENLISIPLSLSYTRLLYSLLLAQPRTSPISAYGTCPRTLLYCQLACIARIYTS